AGPAGAGGRVSRAGRGLAARSAAGQRGMTALGAAVSASGTAAAAGAGAGPAAIVVNSATPLWYLTRATGLVALVLLTVSMALGVLSSVRYQRPDWPRFVIVGL